MLHFLLDEQISPEVARALRDVRPALQVTTLQDWKGGGCLGFPDDVILTLAQAEGLSLTTYDLRTVVPLLVRLAAADATHGGVILVDQRTIAPERIGDLARALADLWDAEADADWTNRVLFPWALKLLLVTLAPWRDVEGSGERRKVWALSRQVTTLVTCNRPL